MSKTKNGNCYEAKHRKDLDNEDNAFFQPQQGRKKEKKKYQMIVLLYYESNV